ncbi:hypothetical protein OYT1_ch1559 [Ferriphaselus amnicola]|uniref:Uncharacterized protein n=1 Tax=Ferriphaselus amnicola TaxID=1188319 RepID=A0A2Z6GCF2_9PROT|nr:hypothetical protein OYT1_ch1559 [Ferriphaselus amnicola]
MIADQHDVAFAYHIAFVVKKSIQRSLIEKLHV